MAAERRSVPLDEAIIRLRRNDYDEVMTVHRARTGRIEPALQHVDGVIAQMRRFGVEESGETASALGFTLVIADWPEPDGTTRPLFLAAWRDEAIDRDSRCDL